MRTMEARIDRIAPGRVVLSMPVTSAIDQQHGFAHAGATFALGDSAAGYAALSLMEPGTEVLTVEMKVNLIAPAAGTRLIAEGEGGETRTTAFRRPRHRAQRGRRRHAPRRGLAAGHDDPGLTLRPSAPCGSGRPCARQQAVTVLARRQAIVMGPTPPGTGVIAPATATALSKWTSPTSLVLPDPSARPTRLIPTSTTVAPRFTQSPGIISGRPTAATRISARLQTSPRSRVRLWAMVTVQLSPKSNCAMGLPTMFDRPTTTASIPERSP